MFSFPLTNETGFHVVIHLDVLGDFCLGQPNKMQKKVYIYICIFIILWKQWPTNYTCTYLSNVHLLSQKIRKARSYVVSMIYIKGMGKSCHRLVQLQKKKALFYFVLSKTQNKGVIHVFLNVHKCIYYILKFWKLVVVISL